MMKSQKLLVKFTKYCMDNPDERFWQALRNWSEYSFIYGQKSGGAAEDMTDMFGKECKLYDTFYIED